MVYEYVAVIYLSLWNNRYVDFPFSNLCINIETFNVDGYSEWMSSVLWTLFAHCTHGDISYCKWALFYSNTCSNTAASRVIDTKDRECVFTILMESRGRFYVQLVTSHEISITHWRPTWILGNTWCLTQCEVRVFSFIYSQFPQFHKFSNTADGFHLLEIPAHTLQSYRRNEATFLSFCLLWSIVIWCT